MEKENIYPKSQAILAAALFGAGAPVAKLFLNLVEPVPMASFLYLGAGAGVLLLRCVQRFEAGNIAAVKIPWPSLCRKYRA